MNTEEDILAIINSEISKADWKAMTRVAIDKARAGDTNAFSGLFRILVKRRPTLKTIKWMNDRTRQIEIL